MKTLFGIILLLTISICLLPRQDRAELVAIAQVSPADPVTDVTAEAGPPLPAPQTKVPDAKRKLKKSMKPKVQAIMAPDRDDEAMANEVQLIEQKYISVLDSMNGEVGRTETVEFPGGFSEIDYMTDGGVIKKRTNSVTGERSITVRKKRKNAVVEYYASGAPSFYRVADRGDVRIVYLNENGTVRKITLPIGGGKGLYTRIFLDNGTQIATGD